MAKFKNQVEELTYQICRGTFLSLWSYANPQGKKPGKELCDILVVSEPHIIIISVKEIVLGKSANTRVDIERWERKAIEGSIKQLYGAERYLRGINRVTRSDGGEGITLPNRNNRKIHRIAIALGSQGKAPIGSCDFGKGFIHVFDGRSFEIILNELDTISDFIDYLDAKVDFLQRSRFTLLEGGEEDLLAVYLMNNRTFPSATGFVSIGEGIWDNFASRKEYKAKKEADKISYLWDGLIDYISKYTLEGKLEFCSSLSVTEIALRTMALEDRYSRRILSEAFDGFLKSSHKIRSRLLTSMPGITYTFLATPHGTNRTLRLEELSIRCFVARNIFPNHPIVIGIATEQYVPDAGFSLDLFYFHKPNWTKEDQSKFEKVKKTLDYFEGPMKQFTSKDEYPI